MKRYLLLAGAVLALAFPYLGLGSYNLHLAVSAGLYALAALGLNLITGYAGQLSLGQAAFYGIGAYTAALLALRAHWPAFAAIPLAVLAAACWGVALGFPTLRLRGPYLVIATLAFGEITRLTFLNWTALTGGPNGLSGIPTLFPGGLLPGDASGKALAYYAVWALVGLIAYFNRQLIHSRSGRALLALREDPLAAQAVGIDVAAYRILAFTLGAALGGLAGALYVYYIGFVSPESFTIAESIYILVLVVVGGRGTIAGPIVGAVGVTYLLENLRGLAAWRLTIYGALLFACVTLAPEGLVGLYGRLTSRWYEPKSQRAAAAVAERAALHHSAPVSPLAEGEK